MHLELGQTVGDAAGFARKERGTDAVSHCSKT